MGALKVLIAGMSQTVGGGASGGIGGSTGSTDNAITRADGTGGSTLQGSLATIDDVGAISAPKIVCSTFQSAGGNISFDSAITSPLIVDTGAGIWWNGGIVRTIADTANALALRNGANGQTWIVSRTFTDASNKSEFQTVATGSTVAFTIVEAGTGVGTLTGYTFDKPVTAGANAIKGLITTNANATTGLIAGALAALTNASVVIYDGTGTAYRVPCVTP